MKFIKEKLDLILPLSLLLFTPLFFYKLGQSTLVSWDEAWYAEVARNILKSGDLLNLTWNGTPFYDHPGTGYWLIALAFKIFGVSEFSARFVSAVAGLSTMVFLYYLGARLFNRTVGYLSAIALPSAYWFLYRSRTGNLDIFLTLFFITSLFFAIKSTDNKKFLIPFAISFSLLVLTKTMVPLTILPALIIIFWGAKIHLKDLLLPAFIIVSLVGSWFISQIITNPIFLNRYFSIGLPGVESQTNLLENLKFSKDYLYLGVGRWFWPGVLSCLLGLLLSQKRFFILGVFFLSFFIPFIFSQKGHIWHLVPLHPILILAFFGFSFTILQKVLKRGILVTILLATFCIYLTSTQIKRSWYEFIDIPAYVSDEAILSREASKYPEELIIQGVDFRPTAVFYSGKQVSLPGTHYISSLFKSEQKFIMIAYLRDLEKEGVTANQYQILKTDRDKILLLKK